MSGLWIKCPSLNLNAFLVKILSVDGHGHVAESVTNLIKSLSEVKIDDSKERPPARILYISLLQVLLRVEYCYWISFVTYLI